MITFLKRLISVVPTPAAGKATIFIDSVSGEPYYKDETGVASTLKGGAGTPGVGVPAGGTTGQVLSKIDGADYNTQWATAIAYTGTANRISLTGSSFDIAASYVGQASITTLGTITSGTWSASVISENKGGTGKSAYSVGDTLYASSSTALTALAAGAEGSVLTISSGVPSWAASSAGMTNPMTTGGDIIVGASLGAPSRLGVGANGSLLGVTSGAPGWNSLAGWGIAPLASPALTGTPSAPTASAGTSTTQIATTAFVNSVSVQTVASAATVTPTFLNDEVVITAQAVALTLANPSGTAKQGWGIVIRIKDNGTSRAITYGTQYRGVGVVLPTATFANKVLYLGAIFNSTETKWDVVSVGQET